MDSHSILDIDKNATESEIKSAYREKIKENHPDNGGERDKLIKIINAKEDLLSKGTKKEKSFIHRLKQILISE